MYQGVAVAEGQETLMSILDRAELLEYSGLTEGQREHLEALIGLLDRDGLLELRGMVDGRLAELQELEQPKEPAGLSSSGSVMAPPGQKAGGWVELKYVNGYGPYAYKRWREGKRLRSEYLGKVKTEAGQPAN